MLFPMFQRSASLDHKRVEVRLQALDELPDSDQDSLARVVRQDSDIQMRTKALGRLTSLEHLQALADEGIECQHAVARLAGLVPPDHPLYVDPRLAALRLQNIQSASEFLPAARCLGDSSAIAEALMSLANPELRLAILDTFRDPALLAEIEKASRRKDKYLHRETRNLRAKFNKLENARKQAIDHAEELIESALACTTSEPHYDSKRDALEAKWKFALEKLSEAEHARAEYGEVETVIPALESRFPERSVIEEPIEVRDVFAPIFIGLAGCGDETGEIEAIEQQWLELTAQCQAPIHIAQRFYRESSEIRSRIESKRLLQEKWKQAESLLEPIAWTNPGDQPATWDSAWETHKAASRRIHDIETFLEGEEAGGSESGIGEELRNVLRQCQDLVSTGNDLKQKVRQKIDEDIASLDEMIAAGESVRADSKAIAVRTQIHRLPEGDRRKPSANLAKRYPTIKELNRWRSFAAVPKREGLCECMEALASNALPANNQIMKIKALRADWLKLGRPKSPHERRLGERFDSAAERAFEPCAEQNERDKADRAKHLETRNQICEQLENFADSVDWKNPDWKSVINIMRTARLEWREAYPVDRNESRKIGKRFYAVTKKIQDQIDQQTRKSTEQKQALIDRAKAAYEDAAMDNDELAELVKGLQAEWKKIGRARKDDEQKLWKNFQEICTQVFEDRANRHYKRKAEVDEQVQSARARVNEASRALRAAIEIGVAPDRTVIAQARADIDQMPLPDQVRSELLRDLSSARRTAQDSIRKAEAQAWIVRFERLLKLDRELSSLEQSNAGVPAEWPETAGADADWFEARTPADPDHLVGLTVRAEMLGGVNSPAGDVQRRVAFQVENLQSEMRGSRSSEREVLDEVMRGWTSAKKDTEELRERFDKAIHSALDRMLKSTERTEIVRSQRPQRRERSHSEDARRTSRRSRSKPLRK